MFSIYTVPRQPGLTGESAAMTGKSAVALCSALSHVWAASACAAIKIFYRIRDKKYAAHDVTVKAACNLVWLWQATKRVAELAEGMLRLRGFVHVSTAYVNAHQPKGSHIEEDIYPLRLSSGQTLLHDSLAAELAGLPHAKAERKVRNPLWASAQESFLFPAA